MCRVARFLRDNEMDKDKEQPTVRNQRSDWPPRPPYKTSQYKCPYGEPDCGENGQYCAKCETDYERIRWSW